MSNEQEQTFYDISDMSRGYYFGRWPGSSGEEAKRAMLAKGGFPSDESIAESFDMPADEYIATLSATPVASLDALPEGVIVEVVL